MGYKEDDFELSEEDLMSVQRSISFEHYGNTAEAEKIFGNRGKKEIEAIKEILEAGANIIVAGSAVFGDHITEQVEKFHKAFEEV